MNYEAIVEMHKVHIEILEAKVSEQEKLNDVMTDRIVEMNEMIIKLTELVANIQNSHHRQLIAVTDLIEKIVKER